MVPLRGEEAIQASLLGLQKPPSRSRGVLLGAVYLQVPLLEGQQSHWIRAHPNDLTLPPFSLQRSCL